MFPSNFKMKIESVDPSQQTLYYQSKTLCKMRGENGRKPHSEAAPTELLCDAKFSRPRQSLICIYSWAFHLYRAMFAGTAPSPGPHSCTCTLKRLNITPGLGEGETILVTWWDHIVCVCLGLPLMIWECLAHLSGEFFDLPGVAHVIEHSGN